MIKYIFPLLIFIASCITVNKACGQSYVSKIERDGRIFVSHDPPNSNPRYFWPVETEYQCIGAFMKVITDTINNNGVYTIYFGTQWVQVREPLQGTRLRYIPIGSSALKDHIMFGLMVACFDKDFVYCQCGQKFPIIKKNF